MPIVINLLIDIGNSSVKASYAKGSSLEEVIRYEGENLYEFIAGLAKRREVEVIAISTVRRDGALFFKELESECNKLIVVDSETDLPVVNRYKSPETLGSDRILSAVAAKQMFPGKDLMIFDFGTALTIDFVSRDGEFLGGNISLGLRGRFKALNDYTQLLPLLDNPLDIVDVGGTTKEAIESGVVLGLIFEVSGYIKEYPNHIYIFTGGDAIYFAEKLKSSIFVVYNLVLMGLARVAENYAKSE
ncbi:MAG: type III pantothenate kinase [Bacteroidetes bacterium HGW-Bacteroidetes-8]|nr:MAG: type III pantothenate kinase [Bacteroidetes bacterium HGW-Bacteroidetes-8]